MPLNAKQTKSKAPTRLLGAALAIFSIIAYNMWFRTALGPNPADAPPLDFRILAIFDKQIVTMENKAGAVSTSRLVPGPDVELPAPWPTPRHGAQRLAEQWKSTLLADPASAVSARCLEFDGRSVLVYWNTEGELCALDGETGSEFLALTDLGNATTVLGPKYLSSSELAVLSAPRAEPPSIWTF